MAVGEGLIGCVFNYHSYLGFDDAAQRLLQMLNQYEDALRRQGFIIVAHSMGGLVARYVAAYAPPTLQTHLHGIALLGTPNAGTIKNDWLVDLLLNTAEERSAVAPWSRSTRCRAARQLTGSDDEGAIADLNGRYRAAPPPVPILSISGGRSAVDGVPKRILKRLPQPNDGLVAEESADITRVITSAPTLYRHISNYQNWKMTNHSDLPHSHEVISQVMTWIKTDALLFARNQISIVPKISSSEASGGTA